MLDRKQAIREFKERKVERGVFAVRCSVSGGAWVGSSRNLDATRNLTFFSLKAGNHRAGSLQTAWNTHGEAAFSYEVLAKLEDDVHELELNDRLKEAKNTWVSRLSAEPLL